MAPMALETEDHTRDAGFNKALHGASSQVRGGLMAMMNKGADAKQASVDAYFQHWDNQPAENETLEQRDVCKEPAPPFAAIH